MIADDLRHDAARSTDKQQQGNYDEEALAGLVHRLRRRRVRKGPLRGGRAILAQPRLHHGIVNHIARIEPLGGTVMVVRHSTPLWPLGRHKGTK